AAPSGDGLLGSWNVPRAAPSDAAGRTAVDWDPTARRWRRPRHSRGRDRGARAPRALDLVGGFAPRDGLSRRVRFPRRVHRVQLAAAARAGLTRFDVRVREPR